jgi:RNA methyltransferase, TrmH family
MRRLTWTMGHSLAKLSLLPAIRDLKTPMLISSPQNPRVKQAIKLRERRERERTGLMLVEGHEELSLALASGAKPRTVFFCRDLPGFKDLADLKSLERQGEELVEVTGPVFEKMAYREGPDGWLAVMPSLNGSLNLLSLTPRPLLLVAEAIEKPGNLGAMLRSADSAGVEGVIVCDPTTDVSNPNVVRSSKGTLFSVPVALATSAEALDWLRQHKISIVAATPQAETIYTQADLRGPTAVVVGTEKEGLTSLWLEAADMAVRIPMCGRVNSLNVATAATLMMYEAVRQRNDK